MGILIDTSVFIALEKKSLTFKELLETCRDQDAFMSVISMSELLHGVHRADSAARRNKRAAIVEAFISEFPTIDVDSTTARIHSRLWAELESAGQIIGPHDLWLAATCIAHGLEMITANAREFRRVPGLTVLEMHPAR